MVRWIDAEMFNALEEYFSAANCDILFRSSQHDHQKEYKILTELLNSEVDGVVLYNTGHPDSYHLIEKLQDQGKPVILLDRFFQDQVKTLNWVTSENTMGAYEITRYLMELGHKRIGMIIRTPEHQYERISTIIEREKGYIIAINEAGLENLQMKEYCVSDETSTAFNQKLARFIVSHQPTALFFHNDVSAYRIHAVLTQNGIRVSQDISIAGFDGLNLFYDILSFDLTTVKQDFANLGQEVGKLVHSLMRNPDHQLRHVRLPVKLHIGNTTAPPQHDLETRICVHQLLEAE